MFSTRMDKLLKQAQQYVSRYFIASPPIVTTHRCSIYLYANQLTIIHINHLPEKIECIASEVATFETMEDLHLVLASIVKRLHLKNVPTYWLLAPEDYQLFLIETLPVEKEELKSALNWRVRSLINYPIEEAVLDHFLIPAKKNTADHPMIAAVSAKANHLAKRIEMIKKAGLLLTTIDIPELAMRNVTATLEEDEKPTAFFYFFENSMIINITCKKILYFTRQIELSRKNDADNAINFEDICLNILRYFDYFQSQWRYPNPNRIFVASEKTSANDIAKALSELLSLSVEPISTDHFTLLKNKTAMQGSILPIGCALREVAHAAPGN